MRLKQWLEAKLFSHAAAGSLVPRIVTGIVVVPLFFLTPFLSLTIFQIILWASGAIAAREWVRMVIPLQWRSSILPIYSLVMILGLISLFISPSVSFILMIVAGLVILGAAKFKLIERAWLVFGLIYITLAIYALSVVTNPAVIVFLLLGVAAADTGAFFVGKSVGGPRLWPEVSPKKTWSGFMGGLVMAALAGWIFALAVDSDMPAVTVATIIAVALAGQAGDLLESSIKRHHKIKDTGNLLPGHGGILDRADGYLLAAPLFVMALQIFEIHQPW